MQSTLTIYPHITKIQGTDGETLIVEGTQILLSSLIEDYQRFNQSVDALLTKWNHLNPALVFSALAYYYDHQSEIERTLQLIEEKRQKEIAKSLYPDEETYHYIQKQGKLFEQMLPQLLSQYEGYYVYFEDGRVLEADTDEENLLDLVEEKYGLKPMFIEKVEIKN
jgi:uncharacterized protein (DUF433 family)